MKITGAVFTQLESILHNEGPECWGCVGKAYYPHVAITRNYREDNLYHLSIPVTVSNKLGVNLLRRIARLTPNSVLYTSTIFDVVLLHVTFPLASRRELVG